MDVYKAQISLFKKPTSTSVHDRYFFQAEHAVQTFKNIVNVEMGVSIIEGKKGPYIIYTAMKNGVRVGELNVLKLPVYDTARANLDY